MRTPRNAIGGGRTGTITPCLRILGNRRAVVRVAVVRVNDEGRALTGAGPSIRAVGIAATPDDETMAPLHIVPASRGHPREVNSPNG